MGLSETWRGTARDVLDWIAWMEHCAWVQSLCDSVGTAMAVFNSFNRTASAERGRAVLPPVSARDRQRAIEDLAWDAERADGR